MYNLSVRYQTNRRKACKKCDDVRPCQRCLKYSVVCVDTTGRKERRKGIPESYKVVKGIEETILKLEPVAEPPIKRTDARSRYPTATSMIDGKEENSEDRSSRCSIPFMLCTPPASVSPPRESLKMLSDVCSMLVQFEHVKNINC